MHAVLLWRFVHSDILRCSHGRGQLHSDNFRNINI